jgi:hypothetical protein
VREAIVAAVVCTLSDSAGPVELKRATLGSEDRPRVGGGPGVGSPGPEKKVRQGAEGRGRWEPGVAML